MMSLVLCFAPIAQLLCAVPEDVWSGATYQRHTETVLNESVQLATQLLPEEVETHFDPAEHGLLDSIQCEIIHFASSFRQSSRLAMYCSICKACEQIRKLATAISGYIQ